MRLKINWAIYEAWIFENETLIGPWGRGAERETNVSDGEFA